MTRFLAGFVWAKGSGRIDPGNDPNPPNIQYPAAADQTGAAFGVNIDPRAGHLIGNE